MRLAAARIFVAQLDEAIDFYRTLLGAPRSVDPNGAFAVFDVHPSDIIVEAVPDDAPPEDRALVGRFTGISFAVDDLDQAHRELSAAGVAFTSAPATQPWGGRLATLSDPSGNQLHLVQYPERPD
jgi:predicted enzyme related to lactoylglutathione lyase